MVFASLMILYFFVEPAITGYYAYQEPYLTGKYDNSDEPSFNATVQWHRPEKVESGTPYDSAVVISGLIPNERIIIGEYLERGTMIIEYNVIGAIESESFHYSGGERDYIIFRILPEKSDVSIIMSLWPPIGEERNIIAELVYVLSAEEYGTIIQETTIKPKPYRIELPIPSEDINRIRDSRRYNWAIIMVLIMLGTLILIRNERLLHDKTLEYKNNIRPKIDKKPSVKRNIKRTTQKNTLTNKKKIKKRTGKIPKGRRATKNKN